MRDDIIAFMKKSMQPTKKRKSKEVEALKKKEDDLKLGLSNIKKKRDGISQKKTEI